MNENQVRFELHKAQEEFKHVFGITAKAFASPGWLASFFSLKSYDDHNLLYASDCRGKTVFYPTLDYKGYKKTFQTLQIPTTFPTLDELLNSKFFDLKNNLEYDLEKIIDNYVNSFKENQLNILTIHAEFEGMAFYDLFKALVQKAQAQGVQFVPLEEIAKDILRKKSVIPILEVKQAYIDGRSSSVTVHEPYNIEKFKQPFIN
jgi:undecaprenyl phosphate-alpha-L-ara4FN deformylase